MCSFSCLVNFPLYNFSTAATTASDSNGKFCTDKHRTCMHKIIVADTVHTTAEEMAYGLQQGPYCALQLNYDSRCLFRMKFPVMHYCTELGMWILSPIS